MKCKCGKRLRFAVLDCDALETDDETIAIRIKRGYLVCPSCLLERQLGDRDIDRIVLVSGKARPGKARR